MHSDPLIAPRSPLVALGAALLGLGLVKALARLAGFGVLLAVVTGSVAALTVGVGLLRLLVLR